MKQSKYRGVVWHESENKWLSRMLVNNEVKVLGFFDDELEASKAYEDHLNKIKTLNEAISKHTTRRDRRAGIRFYNKSKNKQN